MMRRSRKPRLVALLEPGGLVAVEFREGDSGIELLGRGRTQHVPADLGGAADALATLVESRGGRGGRVILLVRGFGATHHLLQLPPSEPEVWAQVAAREIERLEPGLEEPIVGLVGCGTLDRGGVVQHDVLLGAVPRALVDQVTAALRARQIAVEHVTVVPQAIRRAFQAIDGSAGGSAVVLVMLDGGPVLCLFYEGELRLVVEPPLGGATADTRAHILHDALERGVLHLRQQFRGARPERLYIAAHPGEQEALAEELGRLSEAQGGFQVHALGAPESLLALGAVLDAGEPDGLDLRGARPRSRAGARTRARSGAGAAVPAGGARQRRHRAVLVGALAVVAAWSVAGGAVAWKGQRERAALEAEVTARAAVVDPMLPVLEDRRAHQQRLALLGALESEGAHLQSVLQALRAVVPGDGRLDEVTLARAYGWWEVEVAGAVWSASTAAALSGVQALSRGVERRIGAQDASLADFDYLDAAFTATGRPGVSFRLAFSVPVTPAEGP